MDAGDLASVGSRGGKSNLVHDALDATREGNSAVSDGGRSKAIVGWGRLKSEKTRGEDEVEDRVSEANKGGPVPSTGYLLLMETHEVWRGLMCR